MNNSHWILSVIYIQENSIKIYDSNNAPVIHYLNILTEYLKCEYKYKKILVEIIKLETILM